MRRLLGPALLACVGCATPLGRLGALEKRVDAVETVLGIQQDAVAQAPRLGGPEASAPVASAGAWVPVQAARVAALGGLGGPGLTGGGVGSSPTFSGTVTTGAINASGAITSTGTFTSTTAGSSSFCMTTGNGCFGWNSGTGIVVGNGINPTTAGDNSVDLGASSVQWRSIYAGTKVVVQALKVPVVHGTSTNLKAIEPGGAAMTGGALAVTFTTAFSAAPVCACAHVNTTNSNACVISVAPSTTAVTFAVTSGGTDVLNYICIGDK